MAADMFTPGAIDLFYKPRTSGFFTSATWKYLGTAVTAPEIDIYKVYTPITCDLNAPAPFQKSFNSEQHIVTVTLNRLNFGTYQTLLNGSLNGDPIEYTFKPGRLTLNADDGELLLKYTIPSIIQPQGTAKGRWYYSVTLINGHETTLNGRVQEVSLIFECNPLYYKIDKRFKLYTEKEDQLPLGLTLE